MAGIQELARVILAAGLGAAGAAHFLTPRVFVAHLPPAVPERLLLVYATGLFELVLAGALAWGPPRHRRRIGRVTAVYLAAVFPANVYVALAGVPVYPAPWLAWARLPLQPLLIWWALRCTARG